VLDLARIDVGRLTLSPEEVDPGELVAECLELCAPLAQARTVRLVSHLGDCPTPLWADRGRIKQVLLHLLSRARTAAPARPTRG
jgi:signal transduction histidine kinase